MPFDKTLPDGDLSIGLGDDAIRANNDALETALGEEHVFSTGNPQTGRHKFVVDTTSNINSMSPAPVEGSIALDETIQSGLGTTVPVFFNGSTWEALDVGVSNSPHTDTNDVWTAQQWSDLSTIIPSGVNIAIDLSLSSAKETTASGDITINNPTNASTGDVCTCMLKVLMSGAGHTISWGNEYVTAYGIPPAYENSDGAVNVFFITRMSNGIYIVSSSPGVAAF